MTEEEVKKYQENKAKQNPAVTSYIELVYKMRYDLFMQGKLKGKTEEEGFEMAKAAAHGALYKDPDFKSSRRNIAE
jgi:hypothetical protein